MSFYANNHPDYSRNLQIDRFTHRADALRRAVTIATGYTNGQLQTSVLIYPQ
ncbi:hypothetical protein [Leptolyngbya ohadii]|uniref:hypothetical protein n=1 Tax=Leptolyngbya ohadii TaxID=1962290 RepID=UPI0015C60F46|nr:hypothetical protein [Leptolyngbya ohadii]